jgi:pilus assembly protein CpaB
MRTSTIIRTGKTVNLDTTRVAAGVGLLGSLLIIGYGASTMLRNRAPVAPVVAPVAPAAPTGVWAAKQAIPRGQTITRGELVFMPMRAPLPAGAVTQASAAVGRVAVIDIPAYSLILADRIADDPAKAGLAQMVPVGMRAVTLRTNEESLVGNFVRPGDHVDVQLVLPKAVLPKQSDKTAEALGNDSESRLLLQDVTVLAVGNSLSETPPAATPPGSAARRPEPPHIVTLALAPEQAGELMLARSLGQLFLTLRNPTDIAAVPATTATLADLRAPAIATTPTTRGPRPIEVITGTKSKVIYSINPGEKR